MTTTVVTLVKPMKLLTLLAVWVVALATSSHRHARGDSSVLELPDDGFMVGSLLPVVGEGDGPSRTLRWKSPLFETPFTFQLGAVRGIRFPAPDAGVPPGAWRLSLVDGDALIGDLKALDARSITLTDAAGQSLTIDRRLAAMLERTTEVGHTTVVTTDSVAPWEQSPAESWRALPHALVPLKSPATLAKDVGIPERVQCDITLSLAKNASFRLAVAASSTAPENDPFRIERLAGKGQAARLILVRKELEAARIVEIDPRVLAGDRLTLTLFIDQKTGRAAVTATAAEGRQVVTDITVPPPADRAPSGLLRITAMNTDFAVESIRLASWTTPEPTPMVAPGTIVTRDQGAMVGAAVESFDPATGSVTVVRDGQPSELPIASVSVIAFPDHAHDAEAAAPPADAAAQASTFAITANGGRRVTGRIVRIDEAMLWLRRTGIEGDVAVRLADLQSMRRVGSATASPPLSGREGTLSAAGTRSLGCIAADPCAGRAGALAWQPRGSDNASGFADPAGVDAVVAYAKPATNGRTTDLPSRLILRSGDIVPCVVKSLDEQGIGVLTAAQPNSNGEAAFVRAALVQTVEMMPAVASRTLTVSRIERLLTLPRSQRDAPPQHLVRLGNGDYLRGTVTSLDADAIRIKVMGDTRRVPIGEVARVIWPLPPDAPADTAPSQAREPVEPPAPPAGMIVRAIAENGPRVMQRVTMTTRGLDGNAVDGDNPSLGPCRIDLRQIDRLQIGRAIEREVIVPPYSQWKLKHAPEPRVLREAAGNAG